MSTIINKKPFNINLSEKLKGQQVSLVDGNINNNQGHMYPILPNPGEMDIEPESYDKLASFLSYCSIGQEYIRDTTGKGYVMYDIKAHIVAIIQILHMHNIKVVYL